MNLKNVKNLFFLKSNKYWKYIYILIVFALSCVEQYTPPTLSNKGLLVVNGTAYVETGTCAIQLTRTQTINSKENPTPELNADVVLEEEFGNNFKLNDNKNGNYVATNLSLSYGKKYRLKIKLENGKNYVSTFLATYKSPPIKNINFEPSEEKNVIGNVDYWDINIDADDPETRNKYYAIDYIETWEYRSPLKSTIYLDNRFGLTQILYRDDPDELHKCWKTDSSKSILIYNTLNLNENKISEFKINKINVSTKKLNNAYSSLVRLTTISQEEYRYLENLKKNSELTGSIFDSQPSKVIGNFLNLEDKKDNALGFFAVHSLSQKRTTKKNTDLPNTEVISIQSEDCFPTSIDDNQGIDAILQGYILLSFKIDPFTGKIIGYYRAQQDCADCRLVLPKGTNIKPDYMP